MKAKDFLEFMECIGEPVFVPLSCRERRKTERRIEKMLEKSFWSGINYRVYYDKPTKQFYAVEKRYGLDAFERGESVVLVYGRAHDYYVEWLELEQDEKGLFVKNIEKFLGRRVYV